MKQKFFFINKMKFILFSTYVIIILVISLLLQHSVAQYKNYHITNGTILCSNDMDFCLLNFMYNDKKEIKDLPYSTIGKKGLFSVQIAVSKEDPKNYIIIGSKNIFYGTKFKIFLYVILLCICFLSFLLFCFKNIFYK